MSVLEEAMELPRPEKLKLMEALWADLSRADEDLDSPSWPGDALRETDARLAAGEEFQMDWEDAKGRLRTRS